jgi:hypothetical protein
MQSGSFRYGWELSITTAEVFKNHFNCLYLKHKLDTFYTVLVSKLPLGILQGLQSRPQDCWGLEGMVSPSKHCPKSARHAWGFGEGERPLQLHLKMHTHLQVHTLSHLSLTHTTFRNQVTIRTKAMNKTKSKWDPWTQGVITGSFWWVDFMVFLWKTGKHLPLYTHTQASSWVSLGLLPCSCRAASSPPSVRERGMKRCHISLSARRRPT